VGEGKTLESVFPSPTPLPFSELFKNTFILTKRRFSK
jgi:hypothetical protein